VQHIRLELGDQSAVAEHTRGVEIRQRARGQLRPRQQPLAANACVLEVRHYFIGALDECDHHLMPTRGETASQVLDDLLGAPALDTHA